MKKIILLILTITFAVAFKSFGQKLEENKTDDFTKKTIKRTSWEVFYSKYGSGNAHFRISLEGDQETFDLKLMRDEVFSIDKDEEMLLKLDNGDIVKIQNIQYQVTCNGCGATGLQGSGAEGIQVSYALTKDQVAQLKAHKIVTARINMSDGYVDGEVKEKNAEKIIAALNLL